MTAEIIEFGETSESDEDVSLKVEALNVASRTHCGRPDAEIVAAAKAYYDFLKS